MTVGAKGRPDNVIRLVVLTAVGFEAQLILLSRQYDRNRPPRRVTGLPMESPSLLLTLVIARKVIVTAVLLDQEQVVEDRPVKSKSILQFHIEAIIFAKSVALSKAIIINCPLSEN